MFDSHEPLWLPRGSVRSILALGLTGAVILATFTDVAGESFTALLGLATAAVMFYFKDRPSGT
jgi:hypothetical protein